MNCIVKVMKLYGQLALFSVNFSTSGLVNVVSSDIFTVGDGL